MSVPADERRLPVMNGRAWTFADNLAASDILPARFAALPDAARAGHLFGDLDAGLATALAPGDVLVGGRNLGHGGEVTAAATALAAAGVVAVVAASFGPGFEAAALAAGVIPLEVDAPATFHTGQQLRMNLEGGTIANLSSGDRQPIRNLTEERLAALRARFGR